MAYDINKDNYFENRQPAKSEELDNVIEVASNPLNIQDFEDELYKSSEAITIANGETIAVEVKFRDVPVRNPAAQGYYVGYETATTTTLSPVEAAELEYDDITGLISSPELTTTAVYYAWGALITVTNDYGTDGYCIIVVSGYPLKAEPEIMKAQDNDSIAENGVLKYKYPDNHLIQSRDIAQDIADDLLDSYSTPRKDITLNWRGDPALELNDIIGAPEYQKGDINTRGKFSNYKQTLDFDGTLKSAIDGRKVEVEGVYLFCLCGHYLTIIDINDPPNAFYISKLQFDRNLLSLVQSGNYLYITGSAKLWTVDIFDLRNPKLIDTITNGDDGCSLGNSTGLCANDNYLFVAQGGDSGHVNGFSLTNPAAPAFTTKIQGSGAVAWTLYQIRRMAVLGDYLYTAGSGGGIRGTVNVIDISGLPAALTHVRENNNGEGFFVRLYGDIFYSSRDGTLKSAQITVAPDTVIRDSLGGLSGVENANPVYVKNNYLYFRESLIANPGLETIDVTDPTNLINVGHIYDGDGGAKLSVPSGVIDGYGDYIYSITTNDNGYLEIMSIADDPENPTHVIAIAHGTDGAYLQNPTGGQANGGVFVGIV